tara:strand:+ start:103 stop:324 length:222 start_codon:yes stop_codon:yes gene_type:complete
MTDREILDHVYRELLAGRVHQEMIDFIQTEWQRRDELLDAQEIEHIQGLQIGKDGTVDDQYNEGDAGDNDYQG